MGNTACTGNNAATTNDSPQDAASARASYRRRLSPGVDFQSLSVFLQDEQDALAPSPQPVDASASASASTVQPTSTTKRPSAAAATTKAISDGVLKMGQAVKQAGKGIDKLTHNAMHQITKTPQKVTGAIYKTPRHLQNVFAKPMHDLETIVMAENNALTQAFYKPPVYQKGKATHAFLTGVLQDHFVFAHLPAEVLNTLVLALEQHEATAGVNLITQGEMATTHKDYFYILLSGTVEFIVNGKIVGTADKAGDAFGELALLYSCPRAATVHCATNVTVYRMQQRAFRYILQLQRETAVNTKVALLSQVPMFADLKRRELHKLSECMVPHPFVQGEVLCRRGDPGDFVAIIQRGEILVSNMEMGGATYADFVLHEGDAAGQDGLISDRQTRLADAVAQTDGLLFALSAQALQSVLGPNLKQALQTRGFMARTKRKLGMVPLIHDNAQIDVVTLEAMADLLQTKTYEAGQGIVFQGVRVEAALYFVTQGAVEISSTTPNDLYAKIQAGGFFGEEQLRVDADVMERRQRSRKKKQVYLDVIPTIVPAYTATVTEDCTVQILYLKELRNVIDTTQMGKTGVKAAGDDEAHKIPLKDLRRHKILGAGTFGQVWLVSYDSKEESGKTERHAYALKVQSKYQLCQSGQARAVVHEKNIMAALHHPFLANLVDSYQDTKCVYMLMGLVQGGELHAIIHDDKTNRHGVAEADALFFAAGIQEGLAFLHRRGYVYRDLKPENVLISDRGYPVIVDYGFVKYIESKTYTFCGTPLYLAPEIILNQGHDWGADHWSYGVLMYEMLYGFIPFYEEAIDQMTLFKAIVELEITYPPGCSSMCEDFLKRLLRRRPSRRLGSRGENDIFQHGWLSQIDFHKLFKQEYKSPYVPKLKDPLDVANFSNWNHLVDKTKEHYPPLSAKEEEYFKKF